MRRVTLLACAGLLLSALVLGCKPSTPPSSGQMGEVAGGVKQRAEQATAKVNQVRGEQNQTAENETADR